MEGCHLVLIISWMSGNAVGVQSGPRELETAQQQTRQYVTNVALTTFVWYRMEISHLVLIISLMSGNDDGACGLKAERSLICFLYIQVGICPSLTSYVLSFFSGLLLLD